MRSTTGADDGAMRTGGKFDAAARTTDGAGTGSDEGIWTENVEGGVPGAFVGVGDVKIEGLFTGSIAGVPKEEIDGEGTGNSVVEDEGSIVGRGKGSLVGASSGDAEGWSTGNSVGTLKGGSEGENLSASEGVAEGIIDGGVTGISLGEDEGSIVGRGKGSSVGSRMGCADGAYVGSCIGCCVFTTSVGVGTACVEIAEGCDMDKFDEPMSGGAAEGTPMRGLCSGTFSLLDVCVGNFVGAALSSEGTTGKNGGDDGAGMGCEEGSVFRSNEDSVLVFEPSLASVAPLISSRLKVCESICLLMQKTTKKANKTCIFLRGLVEEDYP